MLNYESRNEIEKFVRQIEKVETAVESNFQQHFVDAMALPHKIDKFPNLAKKVELPADNMSGDTFENALQLLNEDAGRKLTLNFKYSK
ncbi:MAG: hypothetical protein Ct9H300mP28_22560 [Pseudomonadota bacterium]|nr:MAG: hypothetical protein Ct9H300mP28_22560 [Pseudomonadota bacterium]